MKIKEILATIRDLAKSQGYYGRLYRMITDMAKNDPDNYEQLVRELERQNFRDSVDLVLFFET